MLGYLLAVALAVVVLFAVLALKAYATLPAKELKRRAEAGDPTAAQLWRAVSYGPSTRVFLWLVIALASAASFELLARVAPPLLGFIAVTLLLAALFAWLPRTELRSVEARLAVLVTPLVAGLVGTLDPVLLRLYRVTHRRTDGHVHTGVYIRNDLVELIEQQKNQPDNQLSIEELNIASNALQFGQKKVRSVFVPRKKVRTIDANSEISPVLLDELHKTLHSRFPVFDGEPDNFVGTLFLADLTNVGSGKGVRGKVRSHIVPGVAFVHEKDTLADVLHAFYLTKKQVLIVVNKFEEYLGIVTVDDLLKALLGSTLDYDFDQYDSRSAVASKHNKKPKVIDEHIDETLEPPLEAPVQQEA